MTDYLAQVALTTQQAKEQKDIDTLTAQMAPAASTLMGQQALANKLGDQTAPKIERAAAAQALNPGMKAAIGAHGELSFSAAPGSDLGYKTPRPDYVAQNSQGMKVAAGQQGDILSQFDSTFKQIQNSQDQSEIMNINASLQSSAGAFLAAKRAAITDRLNASIGVTQLQQQVQSDKAMDIDFWHSQGTGYQGPTDESMVTLNLLRQKQSDVEQAVAKEMELDPEVVGVKSRLGSINTIIDQKNQILGSASATKAADMGASVTDDRVANARVVMGAPDTPASNAEIRKQLATGNGPAKVAEDMGNESVNSLLVVASTDSTNGKLAVNALNTKFSNPEDTKYLVTQVKNFDTIYGPTLTPEEKKALTPAEGVMAGGVEAQKAQKAAIAQMKVAYVIQKFQAQRQAAFNQGIGKIGEQGGWDAPTDPLLQDVPKVVADIKAHEPNTVITSDLIISRMNWDGNDRVKRQEAMANYIYSQSLKEPNNKGLGMIQGYHSPEATTKLVQSQVVLQQTNQNAQKYLQGRPVWAPLG